MITGIQLHNFQSHRDSVLRFVGGINVIQGQSDSGKTAILRALEWVRLNRPRGTSMIHNGQKESSVTILLTAGQIDKYRSSTKNGYRVEIDGASEQFDVVGSDVPVEVTRALQIDDLNVQRQLDPHFLLFDSPGAIAGRVFQSCNLDAGIKALDRMAADLRQQSREIKDAETESAQMKARIDSPYFHAVEAAHTRQEAAETLLGMVQQQQQHITYLEHQLATLTDLDDEAEHFDQMVRAAEPIIAEADGLEGQIKESEQRLGLLRQFQSDLQVQRRLLANRENIEQADRMTCDATDVAIRIDHVTSDLIYLKESKRNLRLERQNIENLSVAIERLERQIEEEKKSAPICPACGQEIRK